MMKARVKTAETKNAKRIIAVSDIHGSGALLKRLLKKVNFSDADFLVLLGDYVEKGPESLKTLREVMELSKKKNVAALSGNCDTLWEDVRSEKYHQNLLKYMLWRKECLLNEMCAELGIEVRADMDKKGMLKRLSQSYAEEFDWLEALPHIIDTPQAAFVHAGLSGGALELEDAELCMKQDAFYETAPAFQKLVVAGHWPTINYVKAHGGFLSHMPLIDRERRVAAIDGGCGVKSSGQLNALILEDGHVSVEYVDDLPYRSIVSEQEGKQPAFVNAWPHSPVTLLLESEGKSLCLINGEKRLLPSACLYRYKNELYCNDYTDYMPSLKEGDSVAIVEAYDSEVLIKHRGVLGWAEKAVLTVNLK